MTTLRHVSQRDTWPRRRVSKVSCDLCCAVLTQGTWRAFDSWLGPRAWLTRVKHWPARSGCYLTRTTRAQSSESISAVGELILTLWQVATRLSRWGRRFDTYRLRTHATRASWTQSRAACLAPCHGQNEPFLSAVLSLTGVNWSEWCSEGRKLHERSMKQRQRMAALT